MDRCSETAGQSRFDGIELNGGNGHMLNAFHSRVWNRRNDKYGTQSFENRTRFTVEVLHGIKKTPGKDYPVMVALNVAEYGMENVTTLEEGVGMSKVFEKAKVRRNICQLHG